jgi:hypothetical protein
MFTVEVSQEALAAEILRYRPAGAIKFYSDEFVRERCTDAVRLRLMNQREEDERSRIGGLAAAALALDLKQSEARFHMLRETIAADRKKAAKLYKKREARRGGDDLRDLADFVVSGLPQIEEKIADDSAELRAVTWTFNVLREQSVYRERLAIQRTANVAARKIEPDVLSSVRALAKKIHAAHPALGSGSDMFADVADPVERSVLVNLTRLLAQLGRSESN